MVPTDHNQYRKQGYLSKAQAAAYLCLSTRTLEKHLQTIPHFRVGRKILFRRSELDQWLEQYREPVVDLMRIVDSVMEKVTGGGNKR